MDQVQLKEWARNKIKGNLWNLLPAIIVAGILTNLSFEKTSKIGDFTYDTSCSFGFLFFFVQVGLTYFMLNFIHDREYKFNDIFAFSKDFGKDLCVGIFQTIFIFLWTLCFIIPGIIKGYAYALVPMLLTDDNYKNKKPIEILKLSEEMMNGHKMDYFSLQFSFLGWHILAIFTLGLLELWIVPYLLTATTKFLYDVKCDYEARNGMQQSNNFSSQPMNNGMNQPMNGTMNQAMNNAQNINNNLKTCPHCGAQVEADSQFCTNCGQQFQ